MTGKEGGIVDVKGQCVPNGIMSEKSEITGIDEKPVFHCKADGNWILNIKKCECSPGYEADETNNNCIGQYQYSTITSSEIRKF